MILFDFNLVFLDNIYVNDQQKISHTLNFYNNYKHKSNKIQQTNRNLPCFYKASTKDFYSKKNLNKETLLSRNFITKLINRYWRETIFIYTSNQEAEKYVNILKAEGASIYNSHHKEFITNFGKALTLGRIKSSSTNIHINNNQQYIKYIWRKGLNFPLIKYMKQIVQLKNQRDNNIVSRLEQYSFPLFTITNTFNQLILAESPDMLIGKKTSLDLLYNWFIKRIYIDSNSQPVYQGLFFVSPDDAKEYKNYIYDKYLSVKTENKLKVFSSRLDVYYNLTRNKHIGIRFRLIPDLKELGLLISKYRYYRNLRFHPNQIVGKDFFQGQPIYIIDPISVKNKISKSLDLVNYNFPKSDDNVKTDYITIFMNYKTVITAWQKFRESVKLYDLPMQPKITVYNIESFIKDLEKKDEKINQNYLIIPAQESYNFVKTQAKNRLSMNTLDKISKKLIPLQIMVKRIVWSLTSRQPTNW